MAEVYDVCLSFAGEQRPYVEEVATLLRDNGVRVFYDFSQTAELWGKDLATHLDEVYNRQAKFCILFASVDYVRKTWTNLERASALDRLLRERDEYVLPVRFDDTPVPGLRGSIGHLDARVMSPGQVADQVLAKLAVGTKTPTVPSIVLALAAEGAADLARILRIAAAASGVDAGVTEQDGARLLCAVPLGKSSSATVLERLVPEIEDAFGERTGGRLVIGMHRGEVRAGDWGGVDVSTVVDAVRAPAVWTVLDNSGGDCAVVLSARLYDEAGRRSPSWESYQGVPVLGGATAWVRVRGRLRAPRPSGVPRPEPATKTTNNTFNGTTHVQHLGDVNG